MPAKKFPNRACPICVRPVTPQEECENCEHCNLSFHAECWAQAGGCISPGCPNNHRSAASPDESADDPSSELQADLPPEPGPDPAPAPALDAIAPPAAAPASASPDPDKRSLWLRPEGVLLYAAILLACATVLLTAWKLKQKQAARVFEAILASADAAADPHNSVQTIEGYIRSHPDNRFTRRAREQLAEAQSRVAEFEFRQAMRASDEAGEKYESAESLLRAYLASHPDAQYRDQVEKRLADLPRLVDDRDFAAIQRQFPESGDLERRRTAFQAYLDQHPRGAHVDAARKAIAQIPDALEERRVKQITAKLEPLRTDRKWQEAIALIDQALPEIASEKQKTLLLQARNQLVAAEEDHYFGPIVKLPAESPADLEKIIAECRLFLLCYPRTAHAQEIGQLLNRCSGQLCSREWPQLQRELTAGASDPVRCLALIERYARRWQDSTSQQALRRAAIRYRLALFRKALAQFPAVHTGTITRTDGKVFSGEIEKDGRIYRVTSRPGDKPVFIAEDRVKSHQPSAQSAASAEIARQAAALDESKITPADLQTMIALAEKNGLSGQALLARTIAFELNPDDTDCLRTLLAVGYLRSDGFWSMPDVKAPKARAEELLARYKVGLVSAAKAFTGGLRLRLTYTQLGVQREMPLDCSVEFNRCEITSVSPPEFPLTAAARVVFRPVLRAPGGERATGGSASETSASLVSKAAQQAHLEAEIEIHEERQQRPDLGFTMKAFEGRHIVDQVSAFSAAVRAGVESGDQILSINGQALSMTSGAGEMIEKLTPGSDAAFVMQRAGRTFNITLPVENSSTILLKSRYRFRHNLGEGGAVQVLDWADLPEVAVR